MPQHSRWKKGTVAAAVRAVSWVSLSLLNVGLLAQQPAERLQTLAPIPEVHLDSVEAAVRGQLETQRVELEGLLERARNGAEFAPQGLARAFADTGELYLIYDLTQAARVCFENALHLHSEGEPAPRWQFLLSGIDRIENRLDDAVTHLEAVLGVQPKNATALTRLADLEFQRGNLDRAGELYARVTDHPDFAAAKAAGLGRIALARGDAAEAARALERALELQPTANILQYHLGQAYRQLEEREKMRAAFERRGDQAVRYPDPIAMELQNKATGVGAWLALGRLSIDVGKLDIAEERFRKALAIDEGSAEANRSVAMILERQGRSDEALRYYERAVELEPDRAGARYFLARFLVDRAAILVGEGLPNASQNVSDAQRETANGYLARAGTHLERALAQSPDFLAGWVELSGVRARLGQTDQAVAAVDRAIALKPDADDLVQFRESLLNGSAGVVDAELDPETLELRTAIEVLRSGDLDEAERLLQDLAQKEIRPANLGLVWFHLGNLSVERENLGAAVTQYQRSVLASPEVAETHYNLGTVLGRLGRYREAAEAYGTALAWDAGNHTARLSEAMALLLSGQEDVARKRLERALELYPSEIGFAQMLSRVLVAARDSSVRDGERGLRLAERLFEARPSPDAAETLAMALAEMGRFDEAKNVQGQLVEQLGALDDPDAVRFAEGARARLAQYERGEPVRAPWATR